MKIVIVSVITTLALITIACTIIMKTVNKGDCNDQCEESNLYMDNNEIIIINKRSSDSKFELPKLSTIELIKLERFLSHVYILLVLLDPSMDLLPPPSYLSPINLKSYLLKLITYINKLPIFTNITIPPNFSTTSHTYSDPLTLFTFPSIEKMNRPTSTYLPTLQFTQAHTITNIFTCRTGFTKLGRQCYFFSLDLLMWHKAVDVCQNKNADLAYPINTEEIDYLRNHLKTQYKYIGDSWYIGGSDEQKEKQWTWVHNKQPIVLTAWAKGQPRNWNNNEHCLQMWRKQDYLWNDVKCSKRHHYICQQQNP